MEKYKKKRNDSILMAIILVFAIIVYVAIIPNQISMNKKTAAMAFNPATFPKLLTLGIIVVSAFGFILYTIEALKLRKQFADEIAEDKKLLAAKRAEMKTQPFSKRIEPIVPYLTFVLVLAYALIFNYVGFIWATVIIPPIMLFFLGSRKWQHYVAVYVFCAIMYCLFKFVLHVPIR